MTGGCVGGGLVKCPGACSGDLYSCLLAGKIIQPSLLSPPFTFMLWDGTDSVSQRTRSADTEDERVYTAWDDRGLVDEAWLMILLWRAEGISLCGLLVDLRFAL